MTTDRRDRARTPSSIGAGHNGLVAANLLADAGWDVLVLEATEAPGGAVRSAEVTAPGYLSDLYSSFYPLGYASPVLRGLDLDRARAVLAARARTCWPTCCPTAGPPCSTATRTSPPPRWSGSPPGDGERWLHAYDRLAPGGRAAAGRAFTPVPAGARRRSRLLRRLRVAGALRLARRLVLPVRKLGDELFAGEGGPAAAGRLRPAHRPVPGGRRLRACTAGCWPCSASRSAGRCPSAARSGSPTRWSPGCASGAAGSSTAPGSTGCSSPGAGRWASAPPAARLAGPAGGARRRARRPALYLDLVGPAALPPRLVEDLAHFRWDGSTVKVDWALSGAGAVDATRTVAGAGTVHLGARPRRAHPRTPPRWPRGELPRDPFLLVGQMAVADPSHSPPGTESLWSLHPPAVPPALAGRGGRRARRADGGGAGGGRARASGALVVGPARGRSGRPGGRRPEPGRRRARRRHRGRVPAAVPAPDPRPGPRRHPGGPALPGQRVGAPGRRGARRARAPTRPGPRWPGTAPLTGDLYARRVGAAHRAVYR